MDPPKSYEEIIIFAPTPSFLERGDLPLSAEVSAKAERYLAKYKNLRLKDYFWRRNTLILEACLKKSPSELSRELSDIGYARRLGEIHKGEFFQQGGLVTVFPINSQMPLTIEFEGNRIHLIEEAGIIPHENIFPKISGHKLEPGGYGVHEDHGIGIFRGRKTTECDTYLVLEYAPARKGGPAPTRSLARLASLRRSWVGRGGEPDRLLVPERLFKKISPYLGLKNPVILRLGTPLWERTKKKAREKVAARRGKQKLKQMAVEVLRRHSKTKNDKNDW